jgi:hypothetical protein
MIGFASPEKRAQGGYKLSEPFYGPARQMIKEEYSKYPSGSSQSYCFEIPESHFQRYWWRKNKLEAADQQNLNQFYNFNDANGQCKHDKVIGCKK